MNFQRNFFQSLIVFLVTFFVSVGAVSAQNSALAERGEQQKFGNMQVVSQFGHVVFADQPDRATVGMLGDHGIKMVINIRGEAENEGFDEQKAVEEAGIAYLQIPYMDGRTINADAVEEILGLIDLTADSGSKIMVHCTHSQRAGSLLGLALARAGYTHEQANETAREAGMTSEFITRIHNEYLANME